MLRPTDVVRFQTAHYALAPIAGLQMRMDATEVGDVYLVRCNRAEWETVERAYAFKDWHAQYYQANPVFLFRPLRDAIDADIQGIMEGISRDAARLITACRLYKTGFLLEPLYTARFVKSGAMVTREVGPYRTEYLAMPLDGLTWPLEQEEVGELSDLYRTIGLMERTPGTEALFSVLEQFNLSHTPTVPAYFAVHVLFTALEMVFDGVPRTIVPRTTRYTRALQLLRLFREETRDPAFVDFYDNRVHALRTAVHHHTLRDGGIDLGEVRFRLQVPLMLGIRMLMRIHRRDIIGALSPLTRARGWQALDPKQLFNASLDCYAVGDVEPIEAIMHNPDPERT